MIIHSLNTLSKETSPYLRQHADNPVHWQPWCTQSLEQARALNKPILLSIGYSACHWCHVMAHESFEDVATADLMNLHYVNIKVDREERPDLDKIYQTAHQLLTGRSGGWPLTVVLDPATQRPFFAGTYFPKDARYGMPSFADVLTGVAEYFQARPDEVALNGRKVIDALANLDKHESSSDALEDRFLGEARQALEQSFDNEHGGFGAAPKFPHPTNLELLLRAYFNSAFVGDLDSVAANMAIGTLRSIASGGTFDQLEGGFFRYSVDERWMIPHFEKMLYDNGPLATACADAWQLTGEPIFARAAKMTAQWAMTTMQTEQGGYLSSIDADSEGEEGKYYVWSAEELERALNERTQPVMAALYGFDRAANFENRFWHMNRVSSSDKVSEELGLESTEFEARHEEGLQALRAIRREKISPSRDAKILTAWNGLMIKGMVSVGRRLGDERFIESAQRALNLVRTRLWTGNRLFACFTEGEARFDGYLDDYALTLDATLEMLGVEWSTPLLDWAIQLANCLLEQFEDPEFGGFFFTAHDHEALIHRPKPFLDDALPSGNAIAARALNRLGHLTGDKAYVEAAHRCWKAAWPKISRVPHAYACLLTGADEYFHPPQVIVIRGPEKNTKRWLARSHRGFAPRRMSFAIAPGENLPAGLSIRSARSDVVAYVCRGHQCDAPIEDFDDFEMSLEGSEIAVGEAMRDA